MMSNPPKTSELDSTSAISEPKKKPNIYLRAVGKLQEGGKLPARCDIPLYSGYPGKMAAGVKN